MTKHQQLPADDDRTVEHNYTQRPNFSAPQQPPTVPPPPPYPPTYAQQPPPQPQPPKRRRRWPWVVGGIAALIIVIAAVSGGGNSAPPATRAGTASPSPYVAPAPVAPPAVSSSSSYGQASGHYGDQLTAGGLTLTASEPERHSNQYLGSQVCSTVTYHNNGSTPESYNMFDWKFRTSSGTETSASIPFNASPGEQLNSGQLAPGGTVSGKICSDNTVKSASAVVYSPGFGILHQLVWS